MTSSDMVPSRRILVVEDEPSIRDNLVWSLETEGFTTHACGTCREAMRALTQWDFCLAVLDVGLPDGSGFDFCRELRRSSTLPVIFLTARTSEIDRIVGLEIGGDDYLAKPFSPRELTARVRAILRRVDHSQTAQEWKNPPAPTPRFSVNDAGCEIHFHGIPLELSRYEYRLLSTLIKNPGRVYSRAQLMDHAWEEPDASMERTVDSHIKSIRSKLRAVVEDDDPIRTHRGLGYSLVLES